MDAEKKKQCERDAKRWQAEQAEADRQALIRKNKYTFSVVATKALKDNGLSIFGRPKSGPMAINDNRVAHSKKTPFHVIPVWKSGFGKAK